MTPIRVDGATVEPVSLAEMRAYLRLDPDDGGAEDALIGSLIAAARARLEAETRRILAPGTFRLWLPERPRDGRLALPLSPLVAVARAGALAADGTLAAFPPGLVAAGPDPLEAPALHLDAVARAGPGGLAIELRAGFGGDGPPLPPPLALAVRRLAAAWFEHRGDEAGPVLPPDIAALASPYRWLRL
ncbi:head-tail connector protein [Methylobacterium sp. A54F]